MEKKKEDRESGSKKEEDQERGSLCTREAKNKDDRLRVAGNNNAMTGRSLKKPTCGQPVILGLCPKMKNHPLGGWIIILYINFQNVHAMIA